MRRLYYGLDILAFTAFQYLGDDGMLLATFTLRRGTINAMKSMIVKCTSTLRCHVNVDRGLYAGCR